MPIVAALALAASCRNADEARIKATSRGMYDPATGRLTEITYDKNKDGRVDTWVKMDGPRPVSAEIDENQDGIVDRWEYYGDHGQLVKVGILRFIPPANAEPGANPATPNAAATRAAPPPAAQPTGTGARSVAKYQPDEWIYMDAQGKPEHAEYIEVSNVTGVRGVVRREYYKDGKLARDEEDTDGDGIMDRWDTYADGHLRYVEFDEGKGPQATGHPTRRLTYDDAGALTTVESKPDGHGGYLEKRAVGGKEQ